METLLTDFRLDRPTWFYLSLLLIIACYFRFDRLWSLRNLDLGLVLLLSPGLLLAETGTHLGFIWLLVGGAAILVRLFMDGLIRRRPRLPQNLNTAGLAFLMAVCGVFHCTKILTTEHPPIAALDSGDHASPQLERAGGTSLNESRISSTDEPSAEPAVTTRTAATVERTNVVVTDGNEDMPYNLPMRTAVILAHFSLVAALLVLGWRHFGDLSLGIAMATLYLLLPCTSYNIAQLNHVLPSALILWAVIRFRSPLQAGGLMGLACGTLLFPIFLLPLWMTFYGFRNAVRFVASSMLAWVGLLCLIAFATSTTDPLSWGSFTLFDHTVFDLSGEERTGIWAGVQSVWRMPVFALFLAMICVLCWWPREKSVESLVARSAAVLIGIQFWHAHDGGVYLLWYIPLFLVVVFRPSLSHLTPPSAAVWRTREVRMGSQKAPVIPIGSSPARVLFH